MTLPASTTVSNCEGRSSSLRSACTQASSGAFARAKPIMSESRSVPTVTALCPTPHKALTKAFTNPRGHESPADFLLLLDRGAPDGVQFDIKCPVIAWNPVGLGAEFGLSELSAYDEIVPIWVDTAGLGVQ